MDKHLVLQVLIQARGCFTGEGSRDLVCALVAETNKMWVGKKCELLPASPEKLGPFYTLQKAWHLLRLTTILGKVNKQELRLIIKNGGL